MTQVSNLEFKCPSLESLASSIHTADDVKSIQGLLFDYIENGNILELASMLKDDNINTVVLQILLMKTIPNDDDAYCLEPDPAVDHLLGNSFTNLNALQLVCIMGDEDMACLIFDFMVQRTLEMDSKILLLEFIHRTFGQNNTILHLAAYLGQKNLVKKLIEFGASVYVRNDNNYKPIDLVDDQETSLIFTMTPSAPPRSEFNHDTLQKKLTRKNTPAKQNISLTKGNSKKFVKFDSSSMLMDICKNGLSQSMTVNELKAMIHGCDYLEIISPQKNMSLVHIACSYGHSDILEVLLGYSAMLINHQDVEGWSPAHCASAEGHVNILRLLGNYGPMVANDGNGWDFYAESPIDLAIKNYDGESIDDVALPEKRDEILQVLSDLRLIQKKRKLSSISDKIIVHDDVTCVLESSIESLHNSILGSIKDALFLSNDSTLFAPVSENQKTHVFTDYEKESDPKTSITQPKFTNDIRNQIELNFNSNSQFTDLNSKICNSNDTLKSQSEAPFILDLGKVTNNDSELTSVYDELLQTNLDLVLGSNGTLCDDKDKIDLSIKNKLESFPESDATVYTNLINPIRPESNQNLEAIKYNSRNPFLELIFSSQSEEWKPSSPYIHGKESDNMYSIDIKDASQNNSREFQKLKSSSGLSIQERIRRLNQLGVQ